MGAVNDADVIVNHLQVRIADKASKGCLKYLYVELRPLGLYIFEGRMLSVYNYVPQPAIYIIICRGSHVILKAQKPLRTKEIPTSRHIVFSLSLFSAYYTVYIYRERDLGTYIDLH